MHLYYTMVMKNAILKWFVFMAEVTSPSCELVALPILCPFVGCLPRERKFMQKTITLYLNPIYCLNV